MGDRPGSAAAATFAAADAYEILAVAPETLRAWLGELDAAWCAARPAPDAWSPHEVVAHLVFGERTDWLPRVRHILEFGDETPFETFDRAGHADLAKRPLVTLLDTFAGLRAQNLEELRTLALTDADLDRAGRHPELGPVTLRNLLAAWVAHDQTHVAQIARCLASRWRAAIGPWDDPGYLGVLHRRLPRPE